VNPLLVAVLLALSAHRLWRLAALDGITVAPREGLFPDGTKRRELIDCPWCLGTWLTTALWGVTWAVVTSLPVPGLVLGAATALTGVLGTADSAWSHR
jgi:hypothetical protein